MKENQILVLGAYGLAGRTVISGLASLTDKTIIAAGRDIDKLKSVLADIPGDRIRLLHLDAGDSGSLQRACEGSSLVINTIGPYALLGSRIARVAIESGAHYIDCANEQIHYQRLSENASLADEKGLLMVTAAGVIPGLSTLLAAKLLENLPSADSVDIAFAQYRHAYEGSGLGSIMSGVLDAVHNPYALIDGDEKPVLLGKSFKELSLPFPFGKKELLEVPTIDTIALAGKYPLKNIHTWFYLGEQPAWMFSLIRALNPGKRRWAYKLIKKVAHFADSQEFEKAVKAGRGPEALLHVEVKNENQSLVGNVLLKDGAIPMAYLPTILARDILSGSVQKTGLVTPLDLTDFDRVAEMAKDAILMIDVK